VFLAKKMPVLALNIAYICIISIKVRDYWFVNIFKCNCGGEVALKTNVSKKLQKSKETQLYKLNYFKL
jgi:hypothetical protein